MFGFTPLDLIVMGLYLAVVIGIGIWSQLRVKTQEDYFLGGRRFGKVIQTFAAFGSATSADGPVGVATTTFRNGAAGIWSALLLVFCAPLYWITSPWLRRMRVITMGDYYAERYGSRRMAATYALIATIGMMGLLSAGYTAMTKTTMAMTPKPEAALSAGEKQELHFALELNQLEQTDANRLTTAQRLRLEQLRLASPRTVFPYLSPGEIIWSVCLMTVLNAVMGGLTAAFYTDMLQGCFILMLSVMLIPTAWARINAIYGGSGALTALSTLHAHLPEAFFQVFGSPKLPDFTWYYVFTASAVAGITVVAQPNQLVTNGAARDEYAARFGMVTGSFIKRICTILWSMCGLSAVLLYTGSLRDSDFLWGFATRDLLGPINLGLVGLMFVGMLSALMSASNALMLTISGLITHNVYRPLRPGRPERHYVTVGRIAGVLFLVGSALVTMEFDNLLQILKFIWEFFVIFAAAFWLGLKWRRANRAGAWASILIAFFAFYLIPLCLPVPFPSLRTNATLLQETRPEPVTHVYTAKIMDVSERLGEIRAWDAAAAAGTSAGPRPEPLQAGEKFTKIFYLQPQSVFWSQGIKLDAAGRMGSGYFYLDLLCLHALGFDLSRNPYALNESLRIGIRLLFPFVVLIAVSLLTPRDDPAGPARFFAKMRTRVKREGHEADAAEMRLTLADPARYEETKVFPGSDWEFYKWDRTDAVGFFLAAAFVVVIMGFLVAAVSAGG